MFKGAWFNIGTLKPYRETSSLWEPTLASFKSDPSEANFRKVYNCCRRDSSTKSCGSLKLSDGKPTNTCDITFSEFCEQPENMLKFPCRTYINDNYAKMRPYIMDACRDKKPGDRSGWDEMCACHYPLGFYNGIKNKILESWDVPPNLLETNAECIYPPCVMSQYYDETRKAGCKATSFTKCIQENTFDLQGGSSIENVNIKQSVGCGAYQKKERRVGYGAGAGTGRVGSDKRRYDDTDDDEYY
jgi:hypothetical protein